jgi:transposase
MDLTDQQWTIIEPLFEEKWRPGGLTAAAARGATRVR